MSSQPNQSGIQPPATYTDNSNMSFTHDEDDSSMTSDEPSCSSPRLPAASGSSSNQAVSSGSVSAKTAKILSKIVELGSDGDTVQRKDFVQKLQKVWEENSIECKSLPNINKQPLDLYKLYSVVKEKGGFIGVNKSKIWKDVSGLLNTGSSGPAGLSLKKVCFLRHFTL